MMIHRNVKSFDLEKSSVQYAQIDSRSQQRQGSSTSAESLSAMGNNHSTIQRRHKTVEIINVSLIHEGTSPSDDTRLGIITVPVQSWQDMRLPSLRIILRHQLSQVLPQRFIFFSKSRYEILYAQEKDILCSQICDFNDTILIRNSHDLPKLFVRNQDGSEIYGHIFCTFCSTISDLRDIITSSCPEIAGPTIKFHFLHSDGSLVSLDAEATTDVHQILRRHEVRIILLEQVPWDAGDMSSHLKRKAMDVVDHSRTKTLSFHLSALRLSFTSSKDINRLSTDDLAPRPLSTQDSKQLLISYVRAEAAEHALNLKRKLTDIGFSVYLDVHEIKSGIDWQDSLNYAVSNCGVFIPLVTPRYGETQWTNREVKLADVLGKPIIPISFLEEWPPRCLAIQFATTQYISWKTPQQIESEILAGRETEAKDIRQWDSQCIECVAKEIENRLKNIKAGAVSMSKPALTRMKTLLKTFAGRLPASATPVLSTHDTEEPAGPKIVICVHPEQACFGHQLKGWLEEVGHTAWVSSVKGEPIALGAADVIRASQVVDLIELKKETSKNIAANSNIYNITPEQVKVFQEAVDKATLIIIVLSKVFTQSKLCLQQVFYCEHRKQLLPIVFDDFKFPCWLKMLIRTKRLLNANKPGFQKAVLNQVQRSLDPTAKNCLETDSLEANLNIAVHYLRKELSVKECVYVTGSSKFKDSRSEEICRAIGAHLARLDNIKMVTGGCLGTSDLVGRVFFDECETQSKRSTLWHLLPEQESQDVSEQYNQGADGLFPLKDFGKSIFCGNSVWEKEAIAGRCFYICLLIEGDANSAHEVEEFVWSDHIVVPVCCSSGASVGDLRVTDKMYQLPPGVSDRDWQCLNDRSTDPEEIGMAVSRVISSLLQVFHHQDETASKRNIRQADSIPEDPENEEAETDSSSHSPVKKTPSWITKLRTLQTIIHPH
ncbi:uncharacterized protein LOC131932566 [Physella acuta]|uniref:uncharacterized protein LOC131932566 n=1 Tax=Physella acuta TaxID=109671 RepID=UPI0027DAED35|nr:uncharacterized protein LOC131932566 [Physella acuta]